MNDIPGINATQRIVVPASKTVSCVADRCLPASAVALGRKDDDSLLLTDFHLELPQETQIIAAYLVLTPARGRPAGSGPVGIVVSVIDEAWSPQQTARGVIPDVTSAGVQARVSTWNGRILRVDVTELFRRWRNDRDFHGFAVRAAEQREEGEWYAASPATGNQPRLELYVR